MKDELKKSIKETLILEIDLLESQSWRLGCEAQNEFTRSGYTEKFNRLEYLGIKRLAQARILKTKLINL